MSTGILRMLVQIQPADGRSRLLKDPEPNAVLSSLDPEHRHLTLAGNPIFAVDVHPQGGRFATAGSDHRVKIWNMLPVTDVTQELNGAVPKLLATLADHFSPVNVARFSRSGKFLASGARPDLYPDPRRRSLELNS